MILTIFRGSVIPALMTSSGCANLREGSAEPGMQALSFTTLRGCLGGVGSRNLALWNCKGEVTYLLHTHQH